MKKILSALTVLAVLALQASQGALIHHWKLDGDGTDAVGGVTLSETGGLTYGAGQFNQAVSLDGVDDSLRSGSITAIVPATDFTLMAWVNWEAGNGSRGWIAGGQSSGNAGEVFTMSRGTPTTDRKLFANLLPNGGPSITESADGAISDNVWQHVAVTLDSSFGVNLYVNGSPVATNPSLLTHTAAGNFNIGWSTSTVPSWFDGLIDDVAIFDNVLTSTEINNAKDRGAEHAIIPEPSVLALTGLGLIVVLVFCPRYR